MTRLAIRPATLAVSLLSLSMPLAAASNSMPFNSIGSSFSPWSMGGMPGSSSFSPWGMGGMPGGSSFSPWSMGGMPGGSSFSPWSMGGMPGGSSFSPWSMGGMPGGSSFSPWSMGGMPGGSGFSPWSMGGMPGGSSFSPWSMGGIPGGSSFSPWNMGGMPGGSSFSPWNMGNSPWGGNGWNSSIWPWSGSGIGNSWGNPTWMPWSNNSGFFGRRNNDDWITRMFLSNALNQQAPINRGLIPNYPAQGSAVGQSLPAQQPQTVFYPQSPSQLSNTPSITSEPAGQPTAVGFPAASSSFSPFIEPSPSDRPVTNPAIMPMPSSPYSDSKPQAKTWVFPDGSRY